MAISNSDNKSASPFFGDMSDYVAELQLHMSLQSKSLAPTLDPSTDSLHKLIHETQTNVEKLASCKLS